MPESSPVWTDALRAAALLAADPQACGGVVLRAGTGPVRDLWLDALRAALPAQAPIRKMPAGIADDRLLGGLDLAATLRAGRPVAQSGLLAEAHGGIIVVPMAERLPVGTVARLCAALDTGTVSLERDGMQGSQPARFGLVLLDEGGADETVAEALADRLAFRVDLSGIGLRETGVAALGLPSPNPLPHPEAGSRGGAREGALRQPPSALESAFERADAPPEGVAGIDAAATLCAAASDLGIASLRGPLLAARIARLAARCDGRDRIAEADVIEAARLVLAPRATRLPAAEPPEAEEAPAPEAGEPPPSSEDESEARPASEKDLSEKELSEKDLSEKDLDGIVLDAVRAAIPPNLLAQLLAGGPRLRTAKAGRVGAASAAPRAGRPAGSRPGDPRRGRLDLIATLRAAAPWQRLRRRDQHGAVASSDSHRLSFRGRAAGPGLTDVEGSLSKTRRVVVLPDDLRIKKLVQRTETTTIFCVDASGSAALERLAEAKGAVELLLAESYVRRDRVALVAFRGAGAELLLPPTRSLVRAKRALGGLPGGGGTPLAAGIDTAATLALSVRRGGGSPVVVLLTDGRANVARSGEGGRPKAGEEALAAGRMLRSLNLPVLVIDTGARPEGARRLAEAADARYIPLPYADAGGMSAAVRAAIG